MTLDWSDYFKPFSSQKNYTQDEQKLKRLSCLLFFVALGVAVSSLGLSKVESKSFKKNSPYGMKVQKVEEEILSFELKNDLLESEMFLINHSLSEKFKKKEKKEIIKLSKLTGTNAYVGQGIILELSDDVRPLKKLENPNLGTIHNIDLLKLINNLWSEKADAISINEQRILMNTEINCIGPTILINKRRITSPFVIKAGGISNKNLAKLENAHLQILKNYGIKYSIKEKQKIYIPSGGTIILAGEI